MYTGSDHYSLEETRNRASPLNTSAAHQQNDHKRPVRPASSAPWTPDAPQPELAAQLGNLTVSSDLQHSRILAQADIARSPHISESVQRQAMDVVYRPDGFGQHNLKHSHHRMANIYDPNERRTGGSDTSEPVWPVPRMHPQGYAGDRSRDATHFSSPQSDFARHQGASDHYVYDSSSASLRNPIVYSQPQTSWGMTGAPSDYTYPTLPYMNSSQRQAGPYFSSLSYGDGGSGAVNNDGMSRLGHPSSADSSEHAEPLWPLAPNSLEAFAGIPVPPGSAARLTLTSSSDRSKLKTRSSLPPPKQFKCSACDAIFSRNHDLKRHARIHLAVKPFPCGYCDKAFSRKDALKRHVLVKGCGAGSKKPETRRRSATLSKLEHGDGSASIGSGSGRGSRHESVLDMRPRDYLIRDDQAQLQQGLSRSFPSKFETSSWSTNAQPVPNDVYPGNPTSTRSGFTPSIMHDGGEGAEYARDGTNHIGNFRGPAPQTQHLGQFQQYSQLAQPYAYGSHPHSGQYQQVPGGLVTTFTSQEDHSGSSPSDAQSRAALTGVAVPEGSQASYPKDPRASGAVGGTQGATPSLSHVEGSGQSKDRYVQAAFPHPSAPTPAAPGTANVDLKSDIEQPYFGNRMN